MYKRIQIFLPAVLLLFCMSAIVNASEQKAQAGEKIKWQTLGSGGRITSASYRLTSSIGQTAAGRSTSMSLGTNSGFQQAFPSDCCEGIRGNVNGFGATNVQDVTFLVSFLFLGGEIYPCEAEANLNGFGIINVQDLTYLVGYLFLGGPPPSSCP